MVCIKIKVSVKDSPAILKEARKVPKVVTEVFEIIRRHQKHGLHHILGVNVLFIFVVVLLSRIDKDTSRLRHLLSWVWPISRVTWWFGCKFEISLENNFPSISFVRFTSAQEYVVVLSFLNNFRYTRVPVLS